MIGGWNLDLCVSCYLLWGMLLTSKRITVRMIIAITNLLL